MADMVLLCLAVSGMAWGLCAYGVARFALRLWREILNTPKL